MDLERPPLSFDRFTIDFRRRLLLNEGKPVPLDAKAFDLLAYLIDHRAEPTPRDRILKDVWSGKTVSESNLNVQLSALRVALRKAGCPDQLILTSPGPCYRFIGEVSDCKVAASDIPSGPKETPESRFSQKRSVVETCIAFIADRHVISIGVVAGLIILLSAVSARYSSKDGHERERPALSMIVLPFRSLSDNRSMDYLADAVTDDLISDLGHIPTSIVIARESADTVKTLTPQQIGEQENVRYMIEGSLRPEDDNYHVTASLVDTATANQLWSTAFDEPSNRLSELRIDIVRRVENALNLKFDELESERSLHDRPTDPNALDLFFQARARLDKDDSAESLSLAQSLLERVVKDFPSFVDAKAELGWLLLRKVQTSDDDDEIEEDWIRASQVIDDALTISGHNSTAIAAKARKYFFEGRYRNAKSAATSALLIEPGSTDALWILVDCSWMAGDLNSEASYLSRLNKINPDGPTHKRILFLTGVVELLQGKSDASIDSLLGSISDEPDPKPGMEIKGRPERARAWLIAAYGLNHQPSLSSKLFQEYDAIWPYRSVWRFNSSIPSAIANMRVMSGVLEALRAAGMPEVGDSSIGLTLKGAVCRTDPYSPTPHDLRGAQTIGTEEVAAQLAGALKPLVIDVGEGSATMVGATWFDPAGPPETSVAFADRVVKREGSNLARNIIVLGDSAFGCSSYNVAKYLVTQGYSRVKWYRGGEEAWAHSTHQKIDVRPQ